MFTGIIESTGKVHSLAISKAVDLLEIELPSKFKALKKGESLAVDGVCLTLAGKKGKIGRFHLIQETKKRSTLGGAKTGQSVHLERPLKASGRLGGHLVLGHVDGVGEVRKTVSRGAGKSLCILFPFRLRQWLVEKGSIAVDGVSLTLGKISRNAFWVHCAPHTLKVTHLGRLDPKAKVNLETDIIAKLGKDLTSRTARYKLVISNERSE